MTMTKNWNFFYKNNLKNLLFLNKFFFLILVDPLLHDSKRIFGALLTPSTGLMISSLSKPLFANGFKLKLESNFESYDFFLLSSTVKSSKNVSTRLSFRTEDAAMTVCFLFSTSWITFFSWKVFNTVGGIRIEHEVLGGTAGFCFGFLIILGPGLIIFDSVITLFFKLPISSSIISFFHCIVDGFSWKFNCFTLEDILPFLRKSVLLQAQVVFDNLVFSRPKSHDMLLSMSTGNELSMLLFIVCFFNGRQKIYINNLRLVLGSISGLFRPGWM